MLDARVDVATDGSHPPREPPWKKVPFPFQEPLTGAQISLQVYPGSGDLGGFPGSSAVKNLPARQETGDARSLDRWIAGSGRSPGGGHGNPLRCPWRIPWTEEPGVLQSIGSQRVRHD